MMHYSGNVYRPPFEHNSLLLQATVGCSHNRCAFCTMYRDVPFRIESLGQIAADLEEAKRLCPDARRVFLENGDAFVLSAQRLRAIAQMIRSALPAVETITMYASVQNIRTKTDGELRMLRELGIDQLNIGVESGLEEALNRMNKGYTAEEARSQLLRLRQAGMNYGANVIFGAAGAEKRLENARATARLLNETKPYLIFTGTVHADPGCPLYDDLQTGAFRENTVAQYLEEETAFLEALELDSCFYFGLHPSNIAGLYGDVGTEKDRMLARLGRRRETLTAAQLRSIPRRGGEGAVILPSLPWE